MSRKWFLYGLLIFSVIVMHGFSIVSEDNVGECNNFGMKRFNTSATCAIKYANEIGKIFGDQFKWLVQDSMLNELNVARCEQQKKSSVKLTLNIGPGSSGTRSLFLAMVQLNITSYHLGFSGLNCTIHLRHKVVNLHSKFNRDAAIMETDEQNAFWGDNPVPVYWWSLFHQYPHNTRFIMTDMQDDNWLIKRKKPHKAKLNWESTVPLAFHIDELGDHYSSSSPSSSLHKHHKHISSLTYTHNNGQNTTINNIKDLQNELLSLTNVWKVSNETNRAAFAAYRDLIHCSIPHKQLLWLDLKNDPTDTFWKGLITFLETPFEKNTSQSLSISSSSAMSRLIAVGKPYFGDQSCHIGALDCKLTAKNHGELRLLPSVCQS